MNELRDSCCFVTLKLITNVTFLTGKMAADNNNKKKTTILKA